MIGLYRFLRASRQRSEVASRPISNNDIWERLGALHSSVETLRRDVTSADTNARDNRAKVFERLEDVNLRLTGLETDMRVMRPTVQGLTALRSKAGGMILALGIVGSIIGGVLVYFGTEIRAFIFGTPHH